MLTPEEHDELHRLQREHIPIRAMARRLGRDTKTIRRALGRPPQPPPPSKLAPYQALAKERFEAGLRSPRILRELRERGYPGGLTILKAYLQTLGPRRPTRQAFRRFETGPGIEAQSDWSPYRVTIADRETIVHAFAMVLGYSRRNFVAFFRDEAAPHAALGASRSLPRPRRRVPPDRVRQPDRDHARARRRPAALASRVPRLRAPLRVRALGGPPRPAQEARFLARFPDATGFLDGLTHRMTTLTPIHLRALSRLADLYGEAAVREALAVATAYRNFNARAIERILQRAHPTVVPESAVAAGAPRPEALGALDDVDPGSPEDYTLDSMAPTGGSPDGA